jgi:hypothetical protein
MVFRFHQHSGIFRPQVREVLPLLVRPDIGERLVGERLNPPESGAAFGEDHNLLARVRAIHVPFDDGTALGSAVV